MQLARELRTARLMARRAVTEATALAATSPEAVWPWVSEPALVRQWLRGLVECRFPSGWDPNTPVGTRCQPVIRMGGRPVVLEGVITAWEAPHVLEQTAVSEHFEAELLFRLNKTEDGTHVETTVRIEPRSLLARAATPLGKRWVREYLQKSYARLASLTEAGKIPG